MNKMDIVTDTSALLAVILNEPEKLAVVQETQDVSLYAPQSLSWEIGNALSSLLKRGRLSLFEATAAMREYEQMPLTLVEIDLTQALTIAHSYNIYAYDAYMIACAQSLQMPLLSLDRGLLHAALLAGVSVIRVKP